MGISKDRLGRFVRAAVVSGLLGAAGLMVTAGPVHAQDGASDGASDGADDGASDGADDGASDGASDGATDGGTATGGTTTGGTTTGTTAVGAGGGLPQTGNDATAPLLLGGSAVAIALAGRRFLVSRA